MRELLVVTILLGPVTGQAQEEPEPDYLADRGTGIATSMFGTYARPGELLLYPFVEYYHDDDLEYEPADFAMGSTQEYRGRYRATEGLIFIGYGINDWLAVELEAGVIQATLERSPDDTMLVEKLEDSGLSDVEGQLRGRWLRETASRPELFSYFETVFPLSEEHGLIGTSAWELKLGTGIAKGFRWGTVSARAAGEYDAGEDVFEVGEYAVEYLKRITPALRVFAMVEGAQDEIELVPEVQWHLSRYVFAKANCGIGLTSKATDFAPEVGIMFSIPTR
jgi:hypothetical protein